MSENIALDLRPQRSFRDGLKVGARLALPIVLAFGAGVAVDQAVFGTNPNPQITHVANDDPFATIQPGDMAYTTRRWVSRGVTIATGPSEDSVPVPSEGFTTVITGITEQGDYVWHLERRRTGDGYDDNGHNGDR